MFKEKQINTFGNNYYFAVFLNFNIEETYRPDMTD